MLKFGVVWLCSPPLLVYCESSHRRGLLLKLRQYTLLQLLLFVLHELVTFIFHSTEQLQWCK
jgi:hypothetical protein